MSLTNGIELRFHPKEICFPSWYSDFRPPPIHPCFVASGIHRTKDGNAHHCEAYQFYFEDNNAIGLFGFANKSKSLGYHKHDVEGILVMFDTKGSPQYVYFKAHGSGQGSWHKWGACEKTRDGALVVYIALGSHATYHDSSVKIRVMGFANDLVSKNGIKLRINVDSYVLARRHEFTSGIVIYDTIQIVANDSISHTERMFLPFVNNDLKKRIKK